MALAEGQLFGNYRIVRLLGEGGFGEVYLAENPHILVEFLEGVSLQHRLADVGSMTLLAQNLKPENLFLVPDGTVPTGERVKVLDFGIAKIKQSGTRSGMLKRHVQT